MQSSYNTLFLQRKQNIVKNKNYHKKIMLLYAIPTIEKKSTIC